MKVDGTNPSFRGAISAIAVVVIGLLLVCPIVSWDAESHALQLDLFTYMPTGLYIELSGRGVSADIRFGTLAPR